MSNQRLDLVPAPAARAIWSKAIRPIATELGFKPGKTVMKGLIRETPPVRLTFWFQVTMYGFDRYAGGKFVVEFTAGDLSRHASLRDRLWRLLDPLSQREVVRMNNDVISSLPGPSPEVVNALPEFLRGTYLDGFKAEANPSPDADVWFRYATANDAQRWGEFVAARLPAVVTECERRLRDLPDQSFSMLSGTVQKNPEA